MSEVDSYMIAGFTVTCEEQEVDMHNDQPIRVTIGSEENNRSAVLIRDTIGKEVMRLYRGDFSTTSNAITFYDIVPPHNLGFRDKDAVYLSAVQAVLCDLSTKLPSSLPYHQLNSGLERWNKERAFASSISVI